MRTCNYWFDIFSVKTWQDFLEAGGETSGFAPNKVDVVKKVRPGDMFLCYLSGLSRWVGVLEVLSDAYFDDSPIWKETYPYRFRVRIVYQLTPDTGVDIRSLQELSIFDSADPSKWGVHVRSTLRPWSEDDAVMVINAVKEAAANQG